MNAAHHPAWLSLRLAVALLLSGCSAGKPVVSVSGRLLNNGEPLAIPTQGLPPGERGIRVGFLSAPQQGQLPESFFANVNPADGTFTVPGNEGRGIPPGKYRISVSVGAMGQADQLKGAFSELNTPLSVDIGSSGRLTIDVGKKMATME